VGATRLVLFVGLVLGFGCKFPGSAGTDGANPPMLGFQFPASTTDETVGTHAVSVALSFEATDTVTVDVNVSGGSADENDFSLGTQTLTFLPGETQKDVDLSISNDGNEAEEIETIDLELGNATNGVLSHSSHTVSISNIPLPRVAWTEATSDAVEDSGAQQFIIVLDRAPTLPIQLGVGVAGTASSTNDYTVAPLIDIPVSPDVNFQVSVQISPDTTDEFDEDAQLTLTTITGAVIAMGAIATHTHTITDDDPLPTIGFEAASASSGESEGAETIRVLLTPASGKTVTVTAAQTGGNAGAGDFAATGLGALTFLPGETEKTITLTPALDTTDEPNETVDLQLSAVSEATLGGGAYTLQITDDDSPPTITFNAATGNAPEATTPYTIGLTLSEASGFDTEFSVTNTNGSAVGGDYSLGSTGPFTIPAGQTTANVNVTINGDNVDESNESFTISLGALTRLTAGATASHVVTIQDDDTASIRWDPDETDGDEDEGNGGGVTDWPYRVELSTPSAVNVQATLTISGEATGSGMNSDCSVITPAGTIACGNGTTTLTINAGQTFITVTVRVNHDSNGAEGDDNVIMTLTNAVGGTLGTPATRTHNINNDD
jgi:hypothetical protein